MGQKFAAAFHGLASATDAPRLRALKRTILDLAHPFAGAIADAFEDVGLDLDRARIVAEAEAEGARLIGAVPCPDVHGRGGLYPHEELLIPAHEFGCPTCGAQA